MPQSHRPTLFFIPLYFLSLFFFSSSFFVCFSCCSLLLFKPFLDIPSRKKIFLLLVWLFLSTFALLSHEYGYRVLLLGTAAPGGTRVRPASIKRRRRWGGRNGGGGWGERRQKSMERKKSGKVHQRVKRCSGGRPGTWSVVAYRFSRAPTQSSISIQTHYRLIQFGSINFLRLLLARTFSPSFHWIFLLLPLSLRIYFLLLFRF